MSPLPSEQPPPTRPPPPPPPRPALTPALSGTTIDTPPPPGSLPPHGAQERAEDEAEAVRNYTRSKQYIPEELVAPPSAQRRMAPVVVALSRDLPAYAKVRALLTP